MAAGRRRGTFATKGRDTRTPPLFCLFPAIREEPKKTRRMGAFFVVSCK
ncbi:hypothetical protein H2514_10530 [Lysobacter sp. CW239]|jgi:hypothetical protein|nr:hypothetical protein [Lysobacter concretionis]QOD90621.1 hypothetical protein H2514_10530 [Lysobacter sp. CW239]